MSIAVQQLKKAKVAFFADPAYVDLVTTGEGEAHNLGQALKGLGHKVRTFTDISAAGLAAALDGRDVLVVPELDKAALSLSADALAVLRDFVGRGGTLIVSGDGADRATSLLNTVFGLSLADSFDLYLGEPLDRVVQSPLAPITTFSGDPASIPANDQTSFLFADSLPANALDIYAFGNGDAVAAIPFGAGQIVYLGWDWYDGEPVGAQDGGWLGVLQSAVSKSDGKIVGTPGSDSVSVSFQTSPGQALASDYRDVILGKGGDDYLDGDGGNDVVKGGGGNDTIFGGAGKDELRGGGGDDYLGDYGNGAKMWGGGGADTFAFSLPGIAKASKIMDFKRGQDDLLLDLNEFDALSDGVLAASAFRKGSKATTADHRIIYDKNGNLFYDPDGDGAAKKILFAKLDDHPKLAHDDIIVHVFG